MLAHVLAAALLIRNVTVIDPASANVRRGIDVLVDGATIAKIEPHITAPPDAKVIEHLDIQAVDEMVRELVKHQVVVDPTFIAGGVPQP